MQKTSPALEGMTGNCLLLSFTFQQNMGQSTDVYFNKGASPLKVATEMHGKNFRVISIALTQKLDLHRFS